MSSETFQTFSTLDLEPHRSLGAWRRYMSEIYYELEIQAPDRDTIVGSLTKRTIAQMSISRLAADTHRVIRSKYLALGDDAEHFCIVFPVNGTFEYRQRGQENKAGAGDVYILNAQEAYEVDLPRNAELLSVALPSNLMRTKIRGIDDLCGSSCCADPVIAPALFRLIEGALTPQPCLTPERIQDLCLDMVDLMIGPDASRRRSGSRYAESVAVCTIAKARQFIEGALADPNLDAAGTASACGVSIRKLQIAFQKQGTTFGAELLEQRLLRAFRLLRSASASSRMIGVIAADCGFKNQSHFSTRFRERFGHSPRDVR